RVLAHLLAAAVGMAGQALIVLELAAVRLAVLVAAHAAVLDVEALELRRRLAAMTRSTLRGRVLAGEIELRVVRVGELKIRLPRARRMARRALRELLEPRAVLVVACVARLARVGWLRRPERLRVAARALDGGVFADERVAGLLPVIEAHVLERAQRCR